MLSASLVHQAVELASPTIQAIFDTPQCIWGPKLVAIVVEGPDIAEPVITWVGDLAQSWEEGWGDPLEFEKIARWKAATAKRHGMPTSDLINLHPLLLQAGDYMYPGGVVDASGKIGIGVSGINGRADEMIAYILASILNGLAHLAVDDLRDRDISQL